MKRLDEMKKEKEELENLLETVADYIEFMKPVEEELGEDDLEFVTAARGRTSYEQFLQNMKKK
ncbi:MAG: hypothetical protein E7246_06115 [Lachnoclostridium sp.]|nr:hypothetical protein [Lachnoclostridium sp.]